MSDVQGTGGRVPVVVVSWLWVGVPFAWGVYELILKAKNLFGA